jgi:hypothetical protein
MSSTNNANLDLQKAAELLGGFLDLCTKTGFEPIDAVERLRGFLVPSTVTSKGPIGRENPRPKSPAKPGRQSPRPGGPRRSKTPSVSPKTSPPRKRHVEEQDDRLPVRMFLDGKGDKDFQISDSRRQTAKREIQKARKEALRAKIDQLDNPKLVHVAVYMNAYRRLSRRWDSFRKSFHSDLSEDPLRGLPSIDDLERHDPVISLKNILKTDDQGQFRLQNGEGRRFLNGDSPTRECPEELKTSVPPGVVALFRSDPSRV